MFDDFWPDRPLDRMMRVHVSDRADQDFSRTFDLPQDAPSSWLHTALRLSVGRDPCEEDAYSDYIRGSGDNSGSGDGYRLVDDETARDHDGPGVQDRYVIRRLGSRPAVIGEPWVTMINDPASRPEAPTGGDWQSAPAPFRAEHVQHELELEYGYVPAPVKHACILSDGVESGSPLAGLLKALPASGRLRLRAHLDDAALLQQPRFDDATMASLTDGFRWLVNRLGSDGVQQAEDGWLADALLDEVRAGLEWPVAADAADPGRRLSDLTRRLGYARRFRGRVVATTRGYSMASHSRDVIADLKGELTPRFGWRSHSVSSTLALLAIADGSASEPSTLERLVSLGTEQLGSAERPYGSGQMDVAAQTIDPIVSVLAPLGGHGGYGQFTPAVRRLAHAALF